MKQRELINEVEYIFPAIGLLLAAESKKTAILKCVLFTGKKDQQELALISNFLRTFILRRHYIWVSTICSNLKEWQLGKSVLHCNHS